MKLRRIAQTGFTVANMDRSLAFYRDLLGMVLIAEQLGSAEYLGRVTGFPGVQIRRSQIETA